MDPHIALAPILRKVVVLNEAKHEISEGFKKSKLRRLLHPSSPGITKISEETGAAVATLYNWMPKYREMIELADYQKTPDEWTLAEKHDAILEKRRATYAAARAANPQRWSRGPRDWKRFDTVYMNPECGDAETKLASQTTRQLS